MQVTLFTHYAQRAPLAKQAAALVDKLDQRSFKIIRIADNFQKAEQYRQADLAWDEWRWLCRIMNKALERRDRRIRAYIARAHGHVFFRMGRHRFRIPD